MFTIFNMFIYFYNLQMLDLEKDISTYKNFNSITLLKTLSQLSSVKYWKKAYKIPAVHVYAFVIIK